MEPNRVIQGSYDDYQILELVGKGGTSEVFKAKTLNRHNDPAQKSYTRACKILLDHLIDKEDYFKRFQYEAGLAKRLLHSNIVNVYDSGQVDGRPFLILDYIEGPTLSNICKTTERLAPQRAVPIFIQIAKAFQYAHDRGVVHRDLKPSNIMLERNGSSDDFVKVVDFGIAKIISETTLATKMTKTGEVFGTPAYMSPEQCRGEIINERSDIYSLGILMYEVLTGKPPFEGNDSLTVLYKQLSDIPKNIGNIDSDVRLVKRLESIIFKCLEKNPQARYSTMHQVERDLENCLDESVSGSKSIAYIQQMAARFGRLARAVLSKPLSTKGWSVLIVALFAIVSVTALIFVQTIERQTEKQLTEFVNNNPAESRILSWIEPEAPPYARDPKLFQEMEKKFMEQEDLIRALGNTNTQTNFEYVSTMGEAYLSAGSYALADQILAFAEKIATALELKNSKDRYRDLADLQLKKSKSALAQRVYTSCINFTKEALKLHEIHKSPNPDVVASDTIPCWELIGRAALAQKDSTLANEAFCAIYDLAKNNNYFERFPERSTLAFARASDYFIDSGEIEKGRMLLNAAIVGWERTNDYQNEGLALNKLGLTYLKVNDPATAVKLFEKAIEILRKSPKPNNSALGKIMLNEADAYQNLGALDKTTYCRKEAKKLLSL